MRVQWYMKWSTKWRSFCDPLPAALNIPVCGRKKLQFYTHITTVLCRFQPPTIHPPRFILHRDIVVHMSSEEEEEEDMDVDVHWIWGDLNRRTEALLARWLFWQPRPRIYNVIAIQFFVQFWCHCNVNGGGGWWLYSTCVSPTDRLTMQHRHYYSDWRYNVIWGRMRYAECELKNPPHPSPPPPLPL